MHPDYFALAHKAGAFCMQHSKMPSKNRALPQHPPILGLYKYLIN
jgi:hypothetical protein